MPGPLSRTCFFLLGFMLLIAGCGDGRSGIDISGIQLDLEIERFDQELFELNQDSLYAQIGDLYEKYEDFFDVFNVHIINIGPAATRHYPSYLSMFINDPTNREVYEYTRGVFASMEGIEERLSQGFRHYLYHYPDSLSPRVVAYVSRFNQGLFTVERTVGVGLDQYLGSDCSYYKQMGVPRYAAYKKTPERIPLDVMLAWATRLYPFNDSLDNVLSRMIWHGQLSWFVHQMYPVLDDATLMGFNPDQMKWCRNNEPQSWTYLVEEKLLFSSDPMDIRKLVEDAPHTAFYTTESPGRAAVWQGLQIVRAFVERNPALSIHEVMSQDDYQELLRLSRYKP